MQIPVFCSLIPAEFIASLGVKPVFIRADDYLAKEFSRFSERLKKIGALHPEPVEGS